MPKVVKDILQDFSCQYKTNTMFYCRSKDQLPTSHNANNVIRMFNLCSMYQTIDAVLGLLSREMLTVVQWLMDGNVWYDL